MYYNREKKGVQAMCKAMEDMIEKFVLSDKLETALRMLKDEKLSKEKIAEYLELPLEVIEGLTEKY